MKNFLMAFVAGSILALAATNGAKAQISNDIASVKKQSDINIGKPGLSAESNVLNASSIAVNAKALKDFRKSYKNASGEKWVKNEYGFTAAFALNGITNVIYYGKKGNWEASLKTYGEDKFDRNVRSIVKQKYYDDKITQVQEIETAENLGMPTYMVHLEGDSDFKIIRVTDGTMDVYEEYRKQK